MDSNKTFKQDARTQFTNKNLNNEFHYYPEIVFNCEYKLCFESSKQILSNQMF